MKNLFSKLQYKIQDASLGRGPLHTIPRKGNVTLQLWKRTEARLLSHAWSKFVSKPHLPGSQWNVLRLTTHSDDILWNAKYLIPHRKFSQLKANQANMHPLPQTRSGAETTSSMATWLSAIQHQFKPHSLGCCAHQRQLWGSHHNAIAQTKVFLTTHLRHAHVLLYLPRQVTTLKPRSWTWQRGPQPVQTMPSPLDPVCCRNDLSIRVTLS